MGRLDDGAGGVGVGMIGVGVGMGGWRSVCGEGVGGWGGVGGGSPYGRLTQRRVRRRAEADDGSNYQP